MFPSWRLGRPFGINLFVHWTFWLLPLWVFFTAHPENDVLPLALQLGVIFALFGCVVLHELGHSLTARSFGIATERIVLTPIGGMAQFSHPIRGPWPEFCIALAGPLVNFGLAAGIGCFYYVVAALWSGWAASALGVFVFTLLVLNLVMGVFNLLPAFPMDGGRVLRSLLAGPLGHLQATRVAVTVGSVVAVVAGVLGATLLHTPWPLVIAAFVLWNGHAELAHLEREAAIPSVVPVRSTVAWPAPAGRVTVYLWDPQLGRWVRDGSSQA
jgi:Zn-dependent protease